MSTHPINNDADKQHSITSRAQQFAFNSELNVEFLEKSYRQNLQFGKKMFSIFLSTIESDIEQLTTALEANDYEELKNISHKIKNNFTWVGLPRMSSVMYKIETSAKEKSVSVVQHYNEFMDMFKQEYTLVQDEYDRITEYLG